VPDRESAERFQPFARFRRRLSRAVNRHLAFDRRTYIEQREVGN
jgi:hypothetical protein